MCLHSQRAERQPVGLRVERVTVARFHAIVVCEEKAIIGQHAAALRGTLLHRTVSRRLHEASKRLYAYFGPAGCLSKRRQHRQRASEKNRGETNCSEHLM